MTVLNDAFLTSLSFSGGRVVSIGIAPWGIVDRRNELVGKKADVHYHSVSHPRHVTIFLNDSKPFQAHKAGYLFE